MRHKSEALIETIIAVTIIAIATMAAMTVLRTSLKGNEVIGEKIVALNLALEGVEAVRNIRDTNYLRFAADPANCWTNISATIASDCDTANSIQDGTTYALSRDLSGDFFEWTLVEESGTNSGMNLYELDLDGNGAPDSELYAQTGFTNGGVIIGSSVSPYSRTLDVAYTNPADPSNSALMITVVVSWEGENGSQSLSLSKTIANVY